VRRNGDEVIPCGDGPTQLGDEGFDVAVCVLLTDVSCVRTIVIDVPDAVTVAVDRITRIAPAVAISVDLVDVRRHRAVVVDVPDGVFVEVMITSPESTSNVYIEYGTPSEQDIESFREAIDIWIAGY
jgi:hypothetical protein